MLRTYFLAVAALLAASVGCETQQSPTVEVAAADQAPSPQREAAPAKNGEQPVKTGDAEADAAKPKPEAPSACVAKFYPRFEDDSVEAKIIAALAAPTMIDFANTPLNEAIKSLKKQHKIEIQLDRKALDEVGVGIDVGVSRRLKGIALRSALNLILRDLDLTYIIKDEVLRITTPEVAENYLVTRMYDVREFSAPRADGEQDADVSTMIELILSIVSPTTWDSVGGPSNILPYDGILTITQTNETHADIARLLTQLCRLKNGEIKRGTASVPVTAAWANLPEDMPVAAKNLAVIYAALDSETTFDFHEAPLDETVAVIGEAHAINITLDRKSLDEVGIETDSPMTRRLKGLSLRSALQIMLRDMDLTYIVKDEVMLITTPAVSENRLVTRLYPVSDLVVLSEKSLAAKLLEATDKPEPDYETLRQVLSTTVQPTTWDQVGGPGTICFFRPAECLVVAQTQVVHEQIEQVLELLRDSLKRRPAPPKLAAPIPPDRVMTLVYSIGYRHAVPPVVGGFFQVPEESDKKVPEAPKATDPELPLNTSTVLAEQIKKHIAPESWHDKRFTIEPLAKQLVIRQTYAVHKQIARFLMNLEELSPHTYLHPEPIREITAPSKFE